MRRLLTALIVAAVLLVPSSAVATAADRASGLTFTAPTFTTVGVTTATVSNLHLVQLNADVACWEYDIAVQPVTNVATGDVWAQVTSPQHQLVGCWTWLALRDALAVDLDCAAGTFSLERYSQEIAFPFQNQQSGGVTNLRLKVVYPVLVADTDKERKAICKLGRDLAEGKLTNAELVTRLNELLALFGTAQVTSPPPAETSVTQTGVFETTAYVTLACPWDYPYRVSAEVIGDRDANLQTTSDQYLIAWEPVWVTSTGTQGIRFVGGYGHGYQATLTCSTVAPAETTAGSRAK